MTWPIQVLAHHKLRRILIGGDGAERLAGVLTQCAALAHLELASNAIGPAGAKSLAGVLAKSLAGVQYMIGPILGQRVLSYLLLLSYSLA